MVSLAQISAKYSGTANLVKNAERAVRVDEDDESDIEWNDFLDHVKNHRDQVLQFLLTEFQKKSKEPGKCVEYLRKLVVRTHKLSKSPNNVYAIKSAILIFRSLFDLAQANWSLPSQIMDDMMGIGINAVRDYPSVILVKYLTAYALKEMGEQETSLTSRWIEMFVKFIAVLSGRGDIPLESDIVDGKQCREYVVQEICRMDWTKPVVRSYLTVLEEIAGLEGYEIDIILERFGSTLPTMQPHFLHSCVTQIVSIAGSLRPAKVLQIFDKYFLRLQETQKKQPQAPKGQGFNRGKKTATPKQVSLGIVACNFVDASRNCEAVVRELLKRVKASMFDHSLVTTPFMLTVVLAMTNVDYLRIPIIDPLKTTILKTFHDLNLCNSSYWYKEVIGQMEDGIIDCFKYVVKEGSDALEYMSEGLKDLGINLLNSGSLQWKYPMTFAGCRELGSFLVTTVVTNNKEQLGYLLKELLKPDSSAHIECLATCLGQCSRSLGHRDFHGRMSELLHHLPSMSVESASPIVKSILPSLYMSPSLFDDLMIVLRKTFWKSVEAGRICVEVMCVILSNTYVSGNTQIFEAFGYPNEDLIFSQCATQRVGNVARTSDNSSMCTELLHLAKRFYLLNCRVREQLYLGLHRVARRNPVLNDIISGQLYAHTSQYIVDDSECSIKFDLLFEFSPLKDPKVCLKDELGFLVQCVSFVYSKTGVVVNDDTDTASLKSCKEILEKLMIFASSVEVNQLENVASAIIGESGLPSEDNSMPRVIRFVKDTICYQTMQIIEALVEFLSWNSEWAQGKQKLSRMFKKYVDIEKYLKESANPKKRKAEKGKKGKTKGGKKKGDTTKATQIDNENASVVSGSEATTTATSKRKRAEQSLKLPTYFHIINLDSVAQMLRELYGPEDKSKHLKSVRGNDEFELMLLKTVKDKVARLKSRESIRERQRAPGDSLNSLTCLIETIWGRLQTMAEVWKNSDQSQSGDALFENTETVETRLDVISNVLQMFYNEGHHQRVLYFNRYQDQSETEDIACENLFETWTNILQLTSAVYDGIHCRGNPLLFMILNSICQALSSRKVLTQIQDWCWIYMKENIPDQEGSGELLDTAVNLYLTCNKKSSKYSSGTKKDALKLAKAVCLTLGSITETRHSQNTVSWLITKETAPHLLCCIANYVDGQLGMLGAILGRLKAHRQYLGNERSAVIRESCFTMIESVRLISTELIRTNFPPGACANHMLKLVTQFYSVLSSFAEHLIDLNKTTTEDVDIRSFKKIVTSLSQEFKPRIDAMIQHIEHNHRKAAAEKVATAKNPSKISAALNNQFSKDTKLVPNMVYHIEKFDQFVIALSKKVKVDMLGGLKLSTARDYRIEPSKFKHAMQEID